MTELPYSFRIGEFECAALYDGGFVGTADLLFANAPGDQLKKVLDAEGLDPTQLPSSWTCLLISDGTHRLLVDTGFGKGSGPLGGRILNQLDALGISPAEIDLVFLSHVHPDHIGGCTDEEGRLIYPRARYMLGAEEYAFWSDEANYAGLSETMVSFAQKNLPAVERNLILVSPGDEILPGIKVLDAYGHTPGHLGLEVVSQEEHLLYLADLVLHPVHLLFPDWHSRLDMDPETLIGARRRLLSYAAEIHARVLLFHMDFPSLGHLTAEAEGWRWQPARE